MQPIQQESISLPAPGSKTRPVSERRRAQTGRPVSARRLRRSKGNVIVESSLIFTALFFMILGAFDFGQFLFIHQALVERTRYAARWGAIADPTNTTAIRNVVMYNQTDSPAAGTPSYFGLTSAMVQVSTLGSGTADYRLKVLITGYPYSVLSPNIAGTYTGPNVSVVVPIGQ